MAFKKDAKSVFLLVILMGTAWISPADSRMLVLSIQLPPPDVTLAVEQDVLQQKSDAKIQKIGSMSPDKFAKKMIKGLIPDGLIPKTPSGIMALYAGYSTYSDKMGMITFPLRHEGKQVEVVATPSFDLDRLYKQTFSGVFVSQSTMTASGIQDSMPPQKFVFSQVNQPAAVLPVPAVPDATTAGAMATPDAAKSDAGNGNIGMWKVEKSTVQLDAQLPPETVILLINPKNLFVPQGTFMSMVKPHIVLPDIYLIGKRFNDEVLLNNQKNTRYFEEIVVQDGTVVQKEKRMEIRQSAIVND